jgi:hypothetical protein
MKRTVDRSFSLLSTNLKGAKPDSVTTHNVVYWHCLVKLYLVLACPCPEGAYTVRTESHILVRFSYCPRLTAELHVLCMDSQIGGSLGPRGERFRKYSDMHVMKLHEIPRFLSHYCDIPCDSFKFGGILGSPILLSIFSRFKDPVAKNRRVSCRIAVLYGLLGPGATEWSSPSEAE